MPRITKRQLAALEEIARIATMETAGFGFDQERFHAPLETFGPVSMTTPDEFIKARTRVWRESNLVNPLKDLLDEIKGSGS